MTQVWNLKSLLSQTPRFYLQKTDSVTKAEDAPGVKIWVLSRALVVHKFFSFPEQVKGKKRFNLINLYTRTASPFAQTGSYMHWTPEGVAVWMWDHVQVQEILAKENIKPKQVQIVPESAYVAPQSQGARLLQCKEGYEGQIWQQNQLISSRWWKESPTQAQWLEFWRGAGMDALHVSQDLPEVTASSKWLDKNWTHTRPLAGGFTVETLYSAEALAVLGLVMLLPLGFYTGKIMHAWGGVGSMKTQIAEMGTDTQKVEVEKKAAESNLKKINAIVALNPHSHPVHVLRKVIESQPDPSIILTEFKMTGDLVTVMLQGDKKPDPAAMVTLFEAVPGFDQVNADIGAGENTLKLNFKYKKIVKEEKKK